MKARDIAWYLKWCVSWNLKLLEISQGWSVCVVQCWWMLHDYFRRAISQQQDRKLGRAVRLDLTLTCTDGAIKPSAKICRRFLAHVKTDPVAPPWGKQVLLSGTNRAVCQENGVWDVLTPCWPSPTLCIPCVWTQSMWHSPSPRWAAIWNATNISVGLVYLRLSLEGLSWGAKAVWSLWHVLRYHYETLMQSPFSLPCRLTFLLMHGQISDLPGKQKQKQQQQKKRKPIMNQKEKKTQHESDITPPVKKYQITPNE